MRISETNRNTQLAKALRDRGVPATSQCTGVLENARDEPDVFVPFSMGSPVLIECKYEGKETELFRRAAQRLGKRLAPDQGSAKLERVVMGLYPQTLETGGDVDGATLKYAVLIGNTPINPERFPKAGWLEGSVDDLADIVELVGEWVPRAVANNVVTAVDTVAGVLNFRTAKDLETRERLAALLHQEAGVQANGMAATIVVNACLFHNLAAGAVGAPTLAELRQDGKFSQGAVLDAWNTILDHNYLPIFGIAQEIIACLGTALAQEVLGRAAQVVEKLSGESMVTVGDLTGQVFGRLIVDREYLAANYTLPESAALLAGIAAARLNTAWGNPHSVRSLRVGDLACGTGALLSAVYGQVRTRMRRAGLNDKEHHKRLRG